MTNGMKTSEFWLSVAVALAGLALVIAGIILGRDIIVAAGAAQQLGAAAGYALGRSGTKAPRPYLPPSGRL